MRRTIGVTLILVLAVLAPGAAVQAQPVPSPLGLDCVLGTDAEAGFSYYKCNGYVPSFDGLPIATTVTLPAGVEGPLPLVFLRSGSGGDKTEFQSDAISSDSDWKDNWNDVAFAARGYVVLTSTARGWWDSCGTTTDPALFASECLGRSHWIRLWDPRWDVRDMQTLIGELVDDGWADPHAIGSYGFSQGAVESLLLAILNDRVLNVDGTFSSWVSTGGVPLKLAAAIPEGFVASTFYGLIPNGSVRDDALISLGELTNPIGNPIRWSELLFSCSGSPTSATVAPPGVDPSADFGSWCARILAGNPHSSDATTDPVMANMIKEFNIRSPMAYDLNGRVPIFGRQGLTDSVTTGPHGPLLINHLKSIDPDYPIKVRFGDIGHLPAANGPDEFEPFVREGHEFFDYYLRGLGQEPSYEISAVGPICDSGGGGVSLSAETWDGLADSVTNFGDSTAQVALSHGPTPTGIQSDAFATYDVRAELGTTCLEAIPPVAPDVPTWTFPMDDEIVLAGSPDVYLDVDVSGIQAQLNFRMWDVAPDGSVMTLVTRGTYRFATEGSQTVTTQLNPQVWKFEDGHTLLVEIAGNDAPYVQQNNTPFTVTINKFVLELPTNSGSEGDGDDAEGDEKGGFVTKATGGGYLDSSSGGKIKFGFNAKERADGALKGNLQLQDKGSEVKIKIEELTSIEEVSLPCGSVPNSPNSLQFEGTGDLNGSPASFRVCVQDNGEPGDSRSTPTPDLFYLECTAGCEYDTASRTPDDAIDGGNIQIHGAEKSLGAGGAAHTTGEDGTRLLGVTFPSRGTGLSSIVAAAILLLFFYSRRAPAKSAADGAPSDSPLISEDIRDYADAESARANQNELVIPSEAIEEV